MNGLQSAERFGVIGKEDVDPQVPVFGGRRLNQRLKSVGLRSLEYGAKGETGYPGHAFQGIG